MKDFMDKDSIAEKTAFWEAIVDREILAAQKRASDEAVMHRETLAMLNQFKSVLAHLHTQHIIEGRTETPPFVKGLDALIAKYSAYVEEKWK